MFFTISQLVLVDLDIFLFCLQTKEGVFQCMFALGGSECVDNSQGLNNLKVSIERLVSIGTNTTKNLIKYLCAFCIYVAFNPFVLYSKG